MGTRKSDAQVIAEGPDVTLTAPTANAVRLIVRHFKAETNDGSMAELAAITLERLDADIARATARRRKVSSVSGIHEAADRLIALGALLRSVEHTNDDAGTYELRERRVANPDHVLDLIAEVLS